MPEFLFQKIAQDVQRWRRNNYLHKDYPAISEILRFATLEDGSLRYLRSAQLIALEIYCHLRLNEDTPHIFDLYKKYYSDKQELLEILGIPQKSKKVQKIILLKEELPSKCKPCEGRVPPLAEEVVKKLISELSDWQLIEGKKIQKEFKFKDFIEAKYFLDIVSVIADE